MPYSYPKNQFGGDRPKNLTDPETASVAHHRIPWNVLKGALNKVLAREADIGLVEALMRLSPSYDPRLLKDFNAAAFLAYKAYPTRRLSTAQINALNIVEEAIFTLPINLFFGMVRRHPDDDPGGDYMDFTPDDVDYKHAQRRTADGRLQGLRERLFGQLCQAKIDKDAVKKTVDQIFRWSDDQARSSPTAFNPDLWHPGPTPPGAAAPKRTCPNAYRYWLKPTGDEMTVDDIKTMICQVTKRARKSGSR